MGKTNPPFHMTTPYSYARERYLALGVDTEAALRTLSRTPISLHCWQGDDVGGFEASGTELGGGLAVTGSYPGKARTPQELRADLEKAFALIPGSHRLNLHACYAERRSAVDRDAYTVDEFRGWIDWCAEHGLGLDFNPTFFAHPLAKDGVTLSHRDPAIRDFWVEHGKACRRIAAQAGCELGSPVTTNFWIPDGSKDLPFDRRAPRERLAEALDAIFAEPVDEAWCRDAVESKLFGIGSESYVVGSHEFYLGYTITRSKHYCLDAGHFHPTESIGDKISAILQFTPGLLLHVSRGVRWDSDHIVLLDDATRAIMEELVRGEWLERVALGLDYFDASVNRVAAWVLGTRNTQKALLQALLEPHDALRSAENRGDTTSRLALMEEGKAMPFGLVWDEFCERHGVPAGLGWMDEIRRYESDVLSQRCSSHR